ncbi:hypothetical protein C922_05294 [Plasmodium inui San Antonio 1]|uniref:Uncharacterized protein n=1 Tax=Plasmodium inui San Antonio 1 TaxID=1237626 RepID=W6ZYE4_9APIC|nr:hypothetical protein C922_05294 [Plasmodium inui San Antonio 1]EUD64320.1 hypothetical protein C922_05294 [Plasmodium inui San Antonio 1]
MTPSDENTARQSQKDTITEMKIPENAECNTNEKIQNSTEGPKLDNRTEKNNVMKRELSQESDLEERQNTIQGQVKPGVQQLKGKRSQQDSQGNRATCMSGKAITSRGQANSQQIINAPSKTKAPQGGRISPKDEERRITRTLSDASEIDPESWGHKWRPKGTPQGKKGKRMTDGNGKGERPKKSGKAEGQKIRTRKTAGKGRIPNRQKTGGKIKWGGTEKQSSRDPSRIRRDPDSAMERTSETVTHRQQSRILLWM